jgi:hypothetical protein
MARHDRLDSTARRSLLALVGFLLVAGLLSTGSAAAHTFTKTDGNDSPSKIDLRSVSVSHTRTGVVHKVQTFNAWTPQSLQHDSFFIIQIDKNNDRHYERCAFIFYTTRLRGSLTNCGAQFIRFLPVAKLSGTTAKITIPKSQTGNVYWWAGVSVWDGPSPCANVCVDFVPNLFPDILHDLKPPTIEMTTTPLRTWESSTSFDFVFSFSVSDEHSGIESWRVERHTYETTVWQVVSSGGGVGDKHPTIAGVPGHSYYRVVAVDKQGNVKISASRKVFVPREDNDLAPQGSYLGTPTSTPDVNAFMGQYTALGIGDSLSYDYVQTAGNCRPFELIGPGGGDWTVDVEVNGSPFDTIDGTTTPVGDRQVLFSYTVCDSTGFLFTVTGGTEEFGVDGVVSKATG